jgi:hypothetical protein
VLRLSAALLRAEPLLARHLLAVRIAYHGGQSMDWADMLLAALNVLPGIAATAGSDGSGSALGQQALAALSDCLCGVTAAAGCQPTRVLAALCSTALLAGCSNEPEVAPTVPLEHLGDWLSTRTCAGAASMGDDPMPRLPALQVHYLLLLLLLLWLLLLLLLVLLVLLVLLLVVPVVVLLLFPLY